jgi:hypothetical protein
MYLSHAQRGPDFLPAFLFHFCACFYLFVSNSFLFIASVAQLRDCCNIAVMIEIEKREFED